MRLAWLFAFAACTSEGAYVPVERGPLGMNDVSFLLPLPAQTQTPVLATLDGLVPAALFERLVVAPQDIVDTFASFHLVAVRFDLCDRTRPGRCDDGDGRLRLVFQPLVDVDGQTSAVDVALHAFYPIPAADLGPVVDELRRIATLRDTRGPLDVAVLGGATEPLRALVTRYAREASLLRLTVFAQHARSAAITWSFRGEQRDTTTGAFTAIVIPEVDAPEQRTILTGSDTTYWTMPVADAPRGFARAINATVFAGATTAERTTALEALAALEDPLAHAADTAQCVACHVTTFLTARRAEAAGIDPTAIRGRYTAPYDLAVRGAATTTNRSLRAFGYLLTDPMISQRVVNDTAQVLVEIDARFPPAP